jgi:TolB protein
MCPRNSFPRGRSRSFRSNKPWASATCEKGNIDRRSLDGAVIAQWEIHKVIPNGDMSSAGRIDVSPDGQHLLLSVDMNEEPHRKGWEGPLPAVWTFDLTTQKSERLTSKKLFGWNACWLDNDTVLFLSQAVGEKQASLYRMPLSGKDRKLVTKNAGTTSVSQ